MKLSKNTLSIFFLLALLIVFSGCIRLQGNKGAVVNDGGVFKTANKGTNWIQKVLVPTVSGHPASFSAVNVYSVAMDPSDTKAIYYGSLGNGLLYTYDGGENWQKAVGLGNAVIRSVAVAPNDKCSIYVAIGNRLFRSDDCNRNWSQVYFDNDVSATVDAVAIDHYDSKNVFIGVSRGDLVKSSDGGDSWRTIHRFNDRINKVLIDPNDSRNMYVITAKKGIFHSADGGFNWLEFNDILKELRLGFNVKDIILIPKEPDSIYLVMNYGILKSADQGENWEQIELIPPEKKAFINAAVVNPQNTLEMYYVTNTTFNRSVDGGQNWTPFRLPSTRAGWKLMIDPASPNVLYMAVKSLQ